MPITTQPFQFNRLEGGGYNNDVLACISDTEWYADGEGELYYLLANGLATIGDFAVGEVIYNTDNDGIGGGEFDGQSEWYGVRTHSPDPWTGSAQIAADISGSGNVRFEALTTKTGSLQTEIDALEAVDFTAGTGLTGGGTLASNRTFNVASANNGIVANADNIELAVASSTFTGGVKTKLNSEGVISASAQILNAGIVSASVLSTPSQGSVTLTTNGVATALDLGVQSGDSPTFAGLTVNGDLTVTGNTFEAQVTNLNVEDRFILLNSGSNSGDAGIIFGGSNGSANVGSGIFFDNPAGVFGFAQGIGAADTAATHQSKIGNIEVSASSPAAAPTFQGSGTIHVDSSTGELYIYS